MCYGITFQIIAHYIWVIHEWMVIVVRINNVPLTTVGWRGLEHNVRVTSGLQR